MMKNTLQHATRMIAFAVGLSAFGAWSSAQDIVVRAQTVHTMSRGTIEDGVIVIRGGKIVAIGAARGTPIPRDLEVIECAVATPGLVDVHATVGLTGMFNVPADQDVRESSSPVQPQLRAIDAYNPREPLVGYVRSFGVTTIHTGHGPGELISGQTLIAKTRGGTVDEAVLVEAKAVAATLGPDAQRSGTNSPGTRGKAVAMLREALIKAQEYGEKLRREASGEGADDEDDEDSGPSRDLQSEALLRVLRGEAPLMVTANTAQDIASVLRLKDEFGITVWLDMGAEAHGMIPELQASGVPVLLHPTMYRSVGTAANLSYGAAKRLSDAGVPFAIQSGYEAYVPKVRVVLFEAALAAGYGELGFHRALESVTINAAKILGIDDLVGSLEVGKHGDVAMYSGDPFEYTTHCVGVLIEGVRYPGELEYEIKYP